MNILGIIKLEGPWVMLYFQQRLNRMSTYDEKIAAIEKGLAQIRRREAELMYEQEKLQNQLEALKVQRLAENGGLPEDEVNSLKMALTIIGKALSDEDVVFGCLEMVDEEPEKTDGGYHGDNTHRFSIHMDCGFVEDCAIGLRYNVKIKTKDEAVRSIVRSMIDSTEYVDDEEKDEPRNRWSINWDYHDRIILKNPYSREEYYKKK